MKFVVDKRHQLIAGNLVALCPGPEQFRYLVRWFLVFFHGRQSLAGGGTYTFDSCPHARNLRALTERSIQMIPALEVFDSLPALACEAETRLANSFGYSFAVTGGAMGA
jgi:hypothetical protein